MEFWAGIFSIAHNAPLCYKYYMDTTIRNLDPKEYSRLKAYAALKNKNIGEVINEMIRHFFSTHSVVIRSHLDIQ